MSSATAGHTSKIKILIVDDLARVRQDLRTALELIEGLEVIGEAADGHDAVQQAENLKPDVVLMDLKMPGMDGFEATRQITDRNLARGVVVLTIVGSDFANEQAARAGASILIEKGTDIPTLVEAIGKAASPDTASKLD